MNVIEKIRSFAQLPNGWHFGGGARPSTDRINLAALYATILIPSFEKVDAFPGAAGEILLKGYATGSERVELTFDYDNTVTLVHEIDGDDIFYRDGLPITEMPIYLEIVLAQVKVSVWNRTFGSSTLLTTLTQQMAVSQTSLSNLAPMMTVNHASRVFRSRAVTEKAAAYASTFQNTTPALPQFPQYFGDSLRPISLEAA